MSDISTVRNVLIVTTIMFFLMNIVTQVHGPLSCWIFDPEGKYCKSLTVPLTTI